jgi:predicted ATPase
MIKSVTFTKNYDLMLEKKSQKRFPYRTIKPTRYMREKHPFKMFTLFKKGLEIEFNERVNVIVGENGSGKSTLFSLIKQYTGKEPDRLSRIFGDYKTDEEYIESHKKHYLEDYGVMKIDGDLTYKNTIFFSAEHDNPVVAIPHMLNPEDKNFLALTSELFDAQEESHGESMLPVLQYILKNAKNCTIFMDEPETALSLRNQFWLVVEMNKSVKDNGNQIIISTHSLGIINQFQIIFDMETRKWVRRETYVNNILL